MSDDIGSKAAKGAAWLGSGQTIRQAVAVGTNIALARMLFPEDFGLFALAFVAAEVAQVASSFGLGSAIIQKGLRSREVLDTAFWVSLGAGSAFALVLILLSPLLAHFYNNPNLQLLIVPLAINLVICSSMVIPQTLLTQDLQFREITTAQIIGTLSASVAALSLAYYGAGVWALVAQPITGNIITGLLFFIYARWAPSFRFNFSSIRGLVKFSAQLFVDNLISVIGRNLHAFILGKKLSTESLGLFNLASNVTGTVLFQFSSVVVKVMFPTMTSFKDQPEQLQKLWIKASVAIAFATFPAMAGVIAVAPDLVPIVFGEQWIDAIEVLQILSLSTMAYSVLTISGTVLMARGRSDTLLKVSILSTTATAIALLTGVKFGLIGAAISYATVNIATNLSVCYLACREIHLSTKRYLMELFPWFFSSLAMYCIVNGFNQHYTDINPITRLILSIGLGMMTYSLILLTIYKEKTLTMIREVKSLLST